MTNIELKIESLFRKTIRNDSKVKNAYVLVHSDTAGIHLNLAEGTTGAIQSTPHQPNYMASVGKLFTGTIVGLLHEQGALSFNDKISRYLDTGLMKSLHVHKGKDYSHEIQIRHLLNQTSGLPDNFYPLFDRLLEDPSFTITPREAIIWVKQNVIPSSSPGKKAYYTDTNYHLLGLIVENVRGAPFHEALHDLIFTPLDMKHSFMLHASEPMEDSGLPVAEFYADTVRVNDLKGFAGIDYAGGGVVAPLEEVLIFMKALVTGKLVSAETLKVMKSDKAKLYPNFDYGYGIWHVKPIPLLIPEKYNSWGVLGATGAFMFYHPELELYLIGNFNNTSYQRKCVRFMFKIINSVWKQFSGDR
jgi:D-alanyl-D-alanine carboxypeptidase